jgi:ankyrin repeat protein
MSETLPPRPALDWYRKAAKTKLLELRSVDPGARLAEAQLIVAREHGFASWRRLKARIDELVTDLPALFAAIRRDDRDQLRRMLADRPHLARVADGHGQTALHVAAEDNNPDAVDLLLAARADPGAAFGQSAHTALSWALTTMAFDSAAALVRGGVEPDLFCAAGMGDLGRVRAFFDPQGRLRAPASRTGSSRYSPGGTRRPLPTEPREVIADALYLACRNGQAEVVRELLGHAPDLSFRAFLGGTPLHWAHFGASRAVIDMLLAAGADPGLRDQEYGCTPRAFGICVAASWGFLSPFLAVLRNDPGTINLLDGRGTALHEAARAGQEAVVKLLLQVGADRSIRDHQGKTALDLAVAAGHAAVVDLLRPGAGGAAGGDPGLGTGPAGVD